MNSFLPNPPIGMTTFSGQSCVRGTAESCGERLDECGAFTCVETRMGQEMGSMLAGCGFLAWRVAAMAFSLSDAARRTGLLNERPCAPLLRAWTLSAANQNADKKLRELALKDTKGKKNRRDHAVAARGKESNKQHKT